MKLLFFKTDVVSCEKIESIRNDLNHSLGFRNWSFDLEDPNKIFKVEILNTSPDEIIDLLKRLGVACIEDKNYKLKSNDIRKIGNIETVKKMYELFAAKDYNAIRKIFDENINWNQMKGFPNGGKYIGVDAIFEKVFVGFRQNWTNWRATITRYIDSGDGVFVIGFYEGTFNATGKYMKSDFACEYKVKEGKITEFNQYTDTFLIGQAMGLTKE